MPNNCVRALIVCAAALIAGGYAFADVAYLQEVQRLISPSTGIGVVNQITFNGNYMYYSLDAGGFEIRDRYSYQFISNIRSTINSYTIGFVVSGHYAYLAEWTYGLTVLDVTYKYLPIVVAHWNEPGSSYYARSVVKFGNMLYVTFNGKGMYVLDTMQPDNLVTGFYPIALPAVLVTPSENNRLLVSTYDTLYTLNIANPASVFPTNAQYDYPAYTAVFDRGRDFVITTFQYSNANVLRIFDASNIDYLVPLVTYADPLPTGQQHQIRGVTSFGNYIMYIDANDGVYLLDASDIYNMQKVAYFPKPSGVNQLGNTITIDGDRAFVGTRGSGIIVLDISEYVPLNVTRIVPEPATVLLAVPALAGLAGLARMRRRRITE